jgi:hypothetical protein
VAKLRQIALEEREKSYNHFDGWFHPSSHPLLPERLLWWFMSQPQNMIREHMRRENMMSVTVGVTMHAFIETAIEDIGLMVSANTPFSDESTRSRGKVDGITKIYLPPWERQVFEFKTSNARAIDSIDDLDLEKFKKKWPDYYAQVQEYMRISGLRMAVVLVVGMGYPWTMREFHIPYDIAFAEGIKQKYLRVIAAAESDEMPIMACCKIGSSTHRECPARNVCPVNGPRVLAA